VVKSNGSAAHILATVIDNGVERCRIQCPELRTPAMTTDVEASGSSYGSRLAEVEASGGPNAR